MVRLGSLVEDTIFELYLFAFFFGMRCHSLRKFAGGQPVSQE